ncbi:hypothetical protein [Candidatus Kryptonium thompsonii]|nr:hypothetical protein [Candidatus Kryptonium thompsoni]
MRKIFLIFFISLLIISCSTLKPKATGDETEIITYVDSLLYSQI